MSMVQGTFAPFLVWLQAAVSMAWGAVLDPFLAWLQVVIPGVSIILISWLGTNLLRKTKHWIEALRLRDKQLRYHNGAIAITGSRPVPVEDRRGEYYGADIWLSAGVSELGYIRMDGRDEYSTPHVYRLREISLRARFRELWWHFRRRTFDQGYLLLVQFRKDFGDQTAFYWKEEVYLPGRYRIELPIRDFIPFSVRRDIAEEMKRSVSDKKSRKVASFIFNVRIRPDDDPTGITIPMESHSGWFDKKQ